MDEDLFLSEQHPVSLRWVVVEDDGDVAWMYLTGPNTGKPEADCWLYNRVVAPTERTVGRGDTPVVPQTHTSSIGPFQPPDAQDVFFRWSVDGHSVAVLFGSEVFGFIPNVGKGFSKLLSCSGPYGNPIDMELYVRVFGKET